MVSNLIANNLNKAAELWAKGPLPWGRMRSIMKNFALFGQAGSAAQGLKSQGRGKYWRF